MPVAIYCQYCQSPYPVYCLVGCVDGPLRLGRPVIKIVHR